MATDKPGSGGALCKLLAGMDDARLSREWLLTNGRGGFAMGTVLGCPTRRYHGLLTAAPRPPLERAVMLAGVAETLTIAGDTYVLWTVEKRTGFVGDGRRFLHDFDYCNAAPNPWVQWRYRTPRADVVKRATLHTDTDTVTVDYTVSATEDERIEFELRPLLALRDFHALRRGKGWPAWDREYTAGCLWIRDRDNPALTLALAALAPPGVAEVRFDHMPEALDGVFYRVEAFRGYDDTESLLSEGAFVVSGQRRVEVTLAAGAFFATTAHAATAFARVRRRRPVPRRQRQSCDRCYARLVQAADQFVAHRASAGHEGQATLLAGFPWFGDWGRDAFIALEGLLLCPRRFAEAREVLATFAGAQHNGLIPNLFDDYGGACHYNSVDASLWYIHAADRYLTLSRDQLAWRGFLAQTCAAVIDAFVAGTDFNIGVDERGLVHCGHENVQITWMDAKCGATVFTPRHGQPVEVNALWYHALCIGARRFDQRAAARCRELAEKCRASFAATFRRADGQGLFDVVRDDFADPAVRPNQIFAVSLADSPLEEADRRAVLEVVGAKLLTPYGLRSLAAEDPAYRGRYGGSLFERDAAYHQGTVWSWLIGPYVEAYLRVHEFSAAAKAHGRTLLDPLCAHLDEAGLGSVSEIFEGDPPHAPRGCIAQAWSVAELIRVLEMLSSDDLADCHYGAS